MIQKSVRLPIDIYNRLVADALDSGIRQPAVQARVNVIDRLKKGNFEILANAILSKPHIYMNDPKITVRIPDSYKDIIDSASMVVSNGEFSGLLQAILIERYQSNDRS